MMFLSGITLALAYATSSLALYIPGADDWTKLIPDSVPLAGSYDTIPFSFGIVVTPFEQIDGEYTEPSFDGPKLVTTTYTSTVITDGPKPTKAVSPVKQIWDGQIQNGPEDDCDDDDETYGYGKRNEVYDDCDSDDEDDSGLFSSPVFSVACLGENTLQMSLRGGILRDAQNRIGSIVSSHQFQFDGPLPQHGTLYANGWTVSSKGRLALGNSTTFYQCASGDFYNLYDKKIAYQCNPVTLEVVELISC